MDQNMYCQRRRPLVRTRQAIARGALKVGFLGGSITDPRGRDRWSDCVCSWLNARLPGVQLEIENAAIGATGSLSALLRVQREILDRNCDLVFVEYAVNDNGEDVVERRRSREGLIRKLKKAGCDVVCTYTFCKEMLDDMNAGRVPASIADFEILTEHYDVSSIWMAAYAIEQVHCGLLRWEEWLPDGLHPANCGSRYYAKTVCDFLEEELKSVEAPEDTPLPAPVDPCCWENAYEMDLKKAHTQGPWRIQNVMGLAGFTHALANTAVRGSAQFEFEGLGFALTLNFGKLAPDFYWQIDDGEETLCRLSRHEWMPKDGWPRSVVLWHGEQPGRHTIRIRPVMDGASTAEGSVFEIADVGILK